MGCLQRCRLFPLINLINDVAENVLSIPPLFARSAAGRLTTPTHAV